MRYHADRVALALSAVALFAHSGALWADGMDSANASGIAFHYVARVNLNLVDSTGVVYGYVSALSGVSSLASLFNGAPSEATAYLTFRANIRFTSLPGNGALGPGQFAVTPTLIEPGVWSMYYTANPAHKWEDPDTFSNGQAIATLERPWEQFSVYPAFSINAGGARIQSSTPITLGGRTINLRDLAPQGLVDVTSGPPIPLNGSTTTSPIFAASGYSLVAAR